MLAMMLRCFILDFLEYSRFLWRRRKCFISFMCSGETFFCLMKEPKNWLVAIRTLLYLSFTNAASAVKLFRSESLNSGDFSNSL